MAKKESREDARTATEKEKRGRDWSENVRLVLTPRRKRRRR